jgi:hypothetical protein
MEHEFMRRPPYVFPRWIYPALRHHTLALHGRELDDYVLAQPARGFSEFNALGAFAHRYHREAFAWRDTATQGPVQWPLRVFWSWGGIDSRVRAELEQILHPGPHG